MPDYSYIERYHRELAELIEFCGADNEENIRPKFQNCLAAYCAEQSERLGSFLNCGQTAATNPTAQPGTPCA